MAFWSTKAAISLKRVKKKLLWGGLYSGVAGRGVRGSPELPEVSHGNRVNPVRNFSGTGVGSGCCRAQELHTRRP